MEVGLLPEKYKNDAKISKNCDFETKLDRSIKQIIKDEGYLDYKVDKKCISTNGGNYLGILYLFDVTGRTTDGDKEINIFVKNVIDSESTKILSIDSVYNTEIFAYKELSKIFADLQEKANVPEDERYKMARIYKESDAEAIILENITKKGFTTYHRMDTMSLDYLKLCVQHLAKFHALSFVIKEKMPTYFEKKLKCLKQPFIFEEEWLNMCKCVRNIGLNNTDGDIREKLEKAYDDLAVKYVQYAKDETIKTCLCHGDYRPNNIMTKINADGEVTDIIPVDYQLMHYGCPVFDFFYLIYSCTDRKFRKAHISYLKDLYYETFSEFLGYFDIIPELVYPRDEFEKVYKEKLDQGLMFALLLLPFILASENDVPDVSKEMTDMTFGVSDVFRDRIRDVIEEYTEWGWL